MASKCSINASIFCSSCSLFLTLCTLSSSSSMFLSSYLILYRVSIFSLICDSYGARSSRQHCNIVFKELHAQILTKTIKITFAQMSKDVPNNFEDAYHLHYCRLLERRTHSKHLSFPQTAPWPLRSSFSSRACSIADPSALMVSHALH